MSQSRRLNQSRLGKFLVIVALSICSYLFFSRLVVTAVEVKGSSMSPTLLSGDRVILNRFAYLHRGPQRGELVVLRDPETGELVVKRIIGLPFETVQVEEDNVYVNGRRLLEDYVSHAAREPNFDRGPAVKVPLNHYYVLGDNRRNSADSRLFGPVPRENILGVINL